MLLSPTFRRGAGHSWIVRVNSRRTVRPSAATPSAGTGRDVTTPLVQVADISGPYVRRRMMRHIPSSAPLFCVQSPLWSNRLVTVCSGVFTLVPYAHHPWDTLPHRAVPERPRAGRPACPEGGATMAKGKKK